MTNFINSAHPIEWTSIEERHASITKIIRLSSNVHINNGHVVMAFQLATFLNASIYYWCNSAIITRIWCRWPLLAHRQSQRPPKRQHIPKIPSSMPVSLMHRTHTTHILIDHTVVGYTFYCTAVRYESIDLKQLQTDCYKRNYVSNCSSCHVDSFAATWYRFAEMEFDAHRLKIRNANRMETSFFGIEDSVHCVPVAHFSFIRSIYLFLRLLLLFRSYGFGRNANCTLTSYRLLCAKNCKIKLDCEWIAGWPKCRRRNTSEKCQPFNYLIIKHSVRRRLDGEFVRRIHDTCVYGRKAGRQAALSSSSSTPYHASPLSPNNDRKLRRIVWCSAGKINLQQKYTKNGSTKCIKTFRCFISVCYKTHTYFCRIFFHLSFTEAPQTCLFVQLL